MAQSASVSRTSRAPHLRNRTSSPVDRSPSRSVSAKSSAWLNPYIRNMAEMIEEDARPLHSRKDPAEAELPALRRSFGSEAQRGDRHGGQEGWDWRSRRWVNSRYGGQRGHHHHHQHYHHRHRQDSGDESIDGRILRLRQNANRLVNERRLLARRIPRQPSGWVSELEGISERRRRDVYGGEALSRVRREKGGGPRSRRRAGQQHVVDLHGRRKLVRKEAQPRRSGNARLSKADGEIVSALQLLGESIHSSRSFSLQTLEEYLKERAAVRRLQNADNAGAADMGGLPLLPPAHGSSGKLSERTRRSARREAGVKAMDGIPLQNEAEQTISIYPSEDGQDEESEAQRSGCGISWRWLNAHHASKDDSSIASYAGAGCFPAVSSRRSGRRLVSRETKGWDKYDSEGCFTSFGSEDSETAPLMTEPEPFHDYTTDDIAGSSMREFKPVKGSRPKESESFSNGNSFRRSHDGALRKKMVLSLQPPLGIRRRCSLSQKHRPKMLKDLVGQSMVAQSLSNAVLRGKIAPVYLFQGPRGTGKTCASRIFTAALNCLAAEELRPCWTCKECCSFDEGSNFDVREVDGAGNNGVDSMKLLLKHISLPPTSRYKVFVIDECHMLTADAWNAFLKSLEEPPSYVVFILISTDAEQLPRTALSRCQKYLFSKIKDSDIVSRLQKIALLERIDVELAALQLIASQSDGSMRDAEMTLEQISLLGKRATLSAVQELVGMIPEKRLIEFLELALSPDTSSTVKAIRDFMESGVEALSLISQLATLITDIIAGNNRAAAYRLKQVRKVNDERFRAALKILSDAERQLRSCTDRTTWLTAAFLQFSQIEHSGATPYSLGTSITQSPVNFCDTSEKETMEGDAKWESHPSPQRSERTLRGDHKRGHSQSTPYSGSLVGRKVHPCSLSPKSITDVDDAQKMAGASEPRVALRSYSRGQNRADKRQANASVSMDSIWRKVVENSRSNVVKQLLRGEAKLLSLSVTEALAVAHLQFKHPEHKNVAEKARISIVKAFQEALCCPVELKITLVSSTSGEDTAGRELYSPSLSGVLEQDGKLKKIAPLSKIENKVQYNDEQWLPQEQKNQHSGSFRRSSSSKFGVSVASSPRIRLPEPRKPRHSLEVERNAYAQRYNVELMERDQTSILKEKTRDGAGMVGSRGPSARYCQASNAMRNDLNEEHVTDSDSEGSFDKDGEAKPTFSPTPGRGNGYGIGYHDKDGWDSEAEEQHGPSVLCWKGGRMSNGKGKHQRLRRKRRGRLLLRLVPCAQGGQRK